MEDGRLVADQWEGLVVIASAALWSWLADGNYEEEAEEYDPQILICLLHN